MEAGTGYVRCDSVSLSVVCDILNSTVRKLSTDATTWILLVFCGKTNCRTAERLFAGLSCRQNVNKIDTEIF